MLNHSPPFSFNASILNNHHSVDAIFVPGTTTVMVVGLIVRSAINAISSREDRSSQDLTDLSHSIRRCFTGAMRLSEPSLMTSGPSMYSTRGKRTQHHLQDLERCETDKRKSERRPKLMLAKRGCCGPHCWSVTNFTGLASRVHSVLILLASQPGCVPQGWLVRRIHSSIPLWSTAKDHHVPISLRILRLLHTTDEASST